MNSAEDMPEVDDIHVYALVFSRASMVLTAIPDLICFGVK